MCINSASRHLLLSLVQKSLVLVLLLGSGLFISTDVWAETATIERNVPVFSRPSTKTGERTGRLRKGTQVEIRRWSKTRRWAQIQADSTRGWVPARALSVGGGDGFDDFAEPAPPRQQPARQGSQRQQQSPQPLGDEQDWSQSSLGPQRSSLQFAFNGGMGFGSGYKPWNVGGEFWINAAAPTGEFFIGPGFRFMGYSIADETGLAVGGKYSANMMIFDLKMRYLFGGESFRLGPQLGLGWVMGGVTFKTTALEGSVEAGSAQAIVDAAKLSAFAFSGGLVFTLGLGTDFDWQLGGSYDMAFKEGSSGFFNLWTGIAVGF